MKWEKEALGALVKKYGGKIQTGPFGSQLHQHDYKTEGIPVIMPKDIINDRIATESIARISEEDADRLGKHKLNVGDLVLPRRGDINKRALCKPENEGWLCGTGCLKIRLNDEIVDSYFLYYYFTLPSVVESILNKAVGSTMLNLSGTILSSTEIVYPPLPTQRRIASILSAYDDLIENNLRRIKLLEEKAELRYKEIVRGEKLEEKSILDICYVTDGTHDSPKQQSDGFYLVTGKHLIGGFIDFSSAYFISEVDHDKIQKRSKVVNGDIVLSNIGTIGNVAIIDSAFEFSVKNVIIFKPIEAVFTSFLYCYLNSDEMQTRFQQESSGTSQRFISLAYTRALKVCLPNEDVLNEFHNEVSSLLKLKSILNQQNAKLREARDILLPRLMSGEINV